jgi:hypothetical protein
MAYTWLPIVAELGERPGSEIIVPLGRTAR